MTEPQEAAEGRNGGEAADWRDRFGLPPAPVGEAETALVEIVTRAMLAWAVLGDDEADSPGYQTVLVPDRIGAELLGEEVLAALKARGVSLIGPSR